MNSGELSIEDRIKRLEAANPKLHSRYPYTYAYDYLRGIVCADVSRSEMAGRVREAAKILGLDDPLPLIVHFADAYIAENQP